MTSLLQFLEEQGRRWEQIEAEEIARLHREIAEAIHEFGPHLIPTWDPESSPRLTPRFGREVKLVYVGEFTRNDWFSDKSEPERLYAHHGEKVILYLGDDWQLYAYEAYGKSSTRSLGIHRLDLATEDRGRLEDIHELLIRTGLY